MKNNYDTRIVLLESIAQTTSDTLRDIRQDIKDIRQGMKETKQELTDEIKTMRKELTDEIRKIDNRLWANFYWMVSGFATVCALIAKVLHWI